VLNLKFQEDFWILVSLDSRISSSRIIE